MSLIITFRFPAHSWFWSFCISIFTWCVFVTLSAVVIFSFSQGGFHIKLHKNVRKIICRQLFFSNLTYLPEVLEDIFFLFWIQSKVVRISNRIFIKALWVVIIEGASSKTIIRVILRWPEGFGHELFVDLCSSLLFLYQTC